MNRSVKNVCVYCGSGPGRDTIYAESARALGREMADNGVGLVYGGGSLGLMGAVARSVLEGGGHVTGIIPDFLSEREKMLREVQELIVTSSMHERKQMMFDHSDAFIALPGGVGTLEELVEQLTWSQLGQHTKPIVLANIAGYWSPLLALFDQMKDQTFIRAGLNLNLNVVQEISQVLPTIFAIAAGAGKRVAEEAIPEKF